MDLGIDGRTAMVLGASGGLGSAIAVALAVEGARVAACGRDREALDAAISEAGPTGCRMSPVVFDLSDLDTVDRAADEVRSKIGEVDILVNMTGGPPATPASGIAPGDWRHHFDAMVTSVVRLTDHVLPGMRARGWGRIITNTSSGVVAPIPNLMMSNALRATLVGWSKTLAGEVAGDGVTVNVVVPGRIATPRLDELNALRAEREGRTIQEVSDASTATIPVGRYGRPEEYADVVCFLSSERASFVNGSVVRVDGGMIPSI